MPEVDGRGVDVVGREGAADAAFLPVGGEHEVLDDELAAPVEEVGQRLPAFRGVEGVVLPDLHPGKRAALGGERVAPARQILLLLQQRLARAGPFVSRNNVRSDRKRTRLTYSD